MTIKQKQYLLAYLGYYEGTVDGIWGPLSMEATKDFQEAFGGIAVDGDAGAETQKALKHAVAYDMFRISDAVDVGAVDKDSLATGTFWDHIRHWTRAEFKCRCGGKYCNGFPAEPNKTLVELVDDIRDDLGAPGIPSSGLRCASHNAAVGGVSNSRHLTGKALDFMIQGVSGTKLLARAQADSRCRYAYIIDNGPYVHVDAD